MNRAEPPLLVRQALRELRVALAQRFDERLLDLRLFGSYARGEADEDSDVDVFVLLDQMSAQDKRAVYELAAGVSVDFDVLVSPHVFSRERYEAWKRGERAMAADIEKDGIAV